MNKVLATALFAAALSGCASTAGSRGEANPAPCPNAIVLNDAARIIEFEGEELIENVAYTGEIVDVTTLCRYFDDSPIDADVTIDFALGKGPKASEDEKYFKYFVAITRTDREVIAKKEFVVPANFSGKKTVVVTREEIDRIKIDRRGEQTSGLNFEIVVGFSLTAKQAIYNRSGKSLKFPDLK